MMPRRHATCNAGMVAYLQGAGYVTMPAVAEAMRRVDRAHYVRAELLCRRRTNLEEDAYYDTPQSIGYSVTISAPHMHAMTLELLAPYLREGAVALDVGSGSGYLTACMAEMVGAPGRVVGVECVPELVPWSEGNLRRDGKGPLLENGRIKVSVGDGSQGASAEGPFNAIHVGAAAPRLPMALVEQLARPGRLVVPVGAQGHAQELQVVDKDKEGRVTTRNAGQCMFVPLHMPPEDSAEKEWRLKQRAAGAAASYSAPPEAPAPPVPAAGRAAAVPEGAAQSSAVGEVKPGKQDDAEGRPARAPRAGG
eukprot:TRINITY_DN14488_c0_g1_i1.p1 TRINITY_DN14488_c0_g1~~TRINITY_DN14488_c0_g1_i1.p1  ORF type:complete len:308 (-),score=49.08 TRINITY_DN14488_c0_g1_i1:287-1210(-)